MKTGIKVSDRVILSAVMLMGALTGCATVSMVPGETVIETAFISEQSELRQSSNAFISLAEEAHWVQPGQGLWSLARLLADGADEAGKDVRYGDFIFEKYTDAEAIGLVIEGDVQRANKGLAHVMDQARNLLGTEASGRFMRTDLYSFESALVTAQKARRNFSDAAQKLNSLQAGDHENLATAFGVFDRQRQEAQRMADALAARQNSTADSASGV